MWILWSPAKGLTIAWFSVLSVAAMLPVASILLSKKLVDGVIAAMRSGLSTESTRQLVITACILALIAVLIEVLSGCSEWIRTAQTEAILDLASELIQKKSVSVDYSFYESADYHDRLHRARDDAKGRIPALLQHMGSAFQNCLTLVALFSIIAMYSSLALAVLAVSLVPAFFVITRFNWLEHQWWKGTTVGTPLDRVL